MKQVSLIKSLLFLMLALLSVGCGGGSGGGSESGDTNPVKGTTVVDPVNQKVLNTQSVSSIEVNSTAQASVDATVADIQEKLMASSFSANGANASSGVNAAASTTTTANYHLADVIFTIGTDDLTDESANVLEENAAYNYFKTYVADAGKLSAEDANIFYASTIDEFNEAFVTGYYEAAAQKIDAPQASASYSAAIASLPAYAGRYGINTTTGAPRQIFGFIFQMFNPMTYINFMVNIVKAVMTEMLAMMFRMMLLSGTLTKMMIRLALKFPILTSIMISVLETHWGITKQFIPYLKYDAEFGELFMQLAYEQSNLAHFVFQNIDAPLYYAMSVAMQLSQHTTKRLSIMMNWYAKTYFIRPYPASRYNTFVRLLMNTGAPVAQDGTTNYGDGNEFANEKLFYALFSYSLSTEQFIRAMEQVDPDVVKELMDHIFMGTRYNADGSILAEDPIQGTYNIYAIAQGMLTGIQNEGFDAYAQNFLDFIKLVPADRYLDYGMAFAMAGYSYYAQTFPADQQPTMEEFVTFLTGAVSEYLANADISVQDAVDSFNGLLGTLQPYLDEFMANGIANIEAAALGNANIIPDITAISGNINDPITDPLEQPAQYVQAPTSLINVINNFPVMWEKDYSNGAYQGAPLSNRASPSSARWSDMDDNLSTYNWVEVPSDYFWSSSTFFSFIFDTGSIDMYIVAHDHDRLLALNDQYGFSFALAKDADGNDMRIGVNGGWSYTDYKVYKMTIQAGSKLSNIYDLMRYVDGFAFDISGAAPTDIEGVTAPADTSGGTTDTGSTGDSTGGTTDSGTTDTGTTGGTTGGTTDTGTTGDTSGQTVVEPAQPEVLLSDIISDTTMGSWSKDYSNMNYLNNLVYNPWRSGEKWSKMPTWLSDMTWMQIPQDHWFSSSDVMNFNFASGTVDMYLVTTHQSLPWMLDMPDLKQVNIASGDVQSTYGSSMRFYVFKRTIPAGTKIDRIWAMMNYVSGIAFDTANVTP